MQYADKRCWPSSWPRCELSLIGPGKPLAEEGEHLGELGGLGEVEVHLGSRHRVLLGRCSVGRHTLALTPQDTSSATTVAGLAAADNPLTTTDPTGHFVEPATWPPGLRVWPQRTRKGAPPAAPHSWCVRTAPERGDLRGHGSLPARLTTLGLPLCAFTGYPGPRLAPHYAG
jgi:hypothetical protein